MFEGGRGSPGPYGMAQVPTWDGARRRMTDCENSDERRLRESYLGCLFRREVTRFQSADELMSVQSRGSLRSTLDVRLTRLGVVEGSRASWSMPSSCLLCLVRQQLATSRQTNPPQSWPQTRNMASPCINSYAHASWFCELPLCQCMVAASPALHLSVACASAAITALLRHVS